MLFNSKFWLLLYYFLGIKNKLFRAFYPQTDGQTERQNNTIKTYLRVFINFEQNDWPRLLLIAEFAYNNTKNTSIGHILFELNCGYHLRMSYKKKVNFRFKSKSVDKLSAELRGIITVCQENLYHAQKLQK